MGITFQFFKRYEIKSDEDSGFDRAIHYYEGGTLNFTFITTAQIGFLLRHFGVSIPEYDKFEPPVSNELILIEPSILAETCEKAIQLLKTDSNPELRNKYNDDDYLPLFDNDDQKDHQIDKLNENLRYRLGQLIEVSKAGYFLAEDKE